VRPASSSRLTLSSMELLYAAAAALDVGEAGEPALDGGRRVSNMQKSRSSAHGLQRAALKLGAGFVGTLRRIPHQAC